LSINPPCPTSQLLLLLPPPPAPPERLLPPSQPVQEAALNTPIAVSMVKKRKIPCPWNRVVILNFAASLLDR
jgi:hypothetical protein